MGTFEKNDILIEKVYEVNCVDIPKILINSLSDFDIFLTNISEFCSPFGNISNVIFLEYLILHKIFFNW